MKILILGATGMLGHRLFIELSKQHEVWGTISHARIPSFASEDRIYTHIQAEVSAPLVEIFHDVRPDVVINCVAAIPQRKFPTRVMLTTNALFPIDLAWICRDYKARLIHFSTDAVFSGSRGNYTEDDIPDGSDTYALTKRLGEISDQEHVLTLRCCPIGRELNGAHSLVEWFLAQTGAVKGYTTAYFTPLSTHEIARMVNNILSLPTLYGIYHLTFGDFISKYEMLICLKEYFKQNIEIIPDNSITINRTLSSNRIFPQLSGCFDDYSRMLEEMAADNALYEGVHAHQ